jgi:hypothetical protein
MELHSRMDEAAVLSEGQAFLSARGVLMARADGMGFETAPFALYPCPFPRASYEAAVRVTPVFAKLMDAVARDWPWLRETLRAYV